MIKAAFPCLLVLALPACSTVRSVATVPFKVSAQAADWATTSQDEADRNRGRAYREAEERARKTCRKTSKGNDVVLENCVRAAMRNSGWS